MDMIDGLKTTSDLVNHLIDMVGELQMRVRYVEERCQSPPPRKRLSCIMTCKDNVLKM